MNWESLLYIFIGADWQNWMMMKSIQIEKWNIWFKFHVIRAFACVLSFSLVFFSKILHSISSSCRGSFITTQVCPGFVIKRSHKRPEVNRVSLTFVLWWWWTGGGVCVTLCLSFFFPVSISMLPCALYFVLFLSFDFNFVQIWTRDLQGNAPCLLSLFHFFFDFIWITNFSFFS